MKVREMLETCARSYTPVRVVSKRDANTGEMHDLYFGNAKWDLPHLVVGEEKQDFSFLDCEVDEWIVDWDDNDTVVIFCK